MRERGRRRYRGREGCNAGVLGKGAAGGVCYSDQEAKKVLFEESKQKKGGLRTSLVN